MGATQCRADTACACTRRRVRARASGNGFACQGRQYIAITTDGEQHGVQLSRKRLRKTRNEVLEDFCGVGRRCTLQLPRFLRCELHSKYIRY